MKNRQDESILWLALYLTKGLGNIACKNLLGKFGDPETIFDTDVLDLIKVKGIRKQVARNIVNKVFALDPEREWGRVEKFGARILTFNDPLYPPSLREIYDPPVLLYLKGNDIPTTPVFLAVVGARNATHYGISAAKNIGRGLAGGGIGVVSGMARGIDSAAHWGCLNGNGFTVAVMGTGIDIVYPRSNRTLFEKIQQSGTIVTEFPMGTPPEARNFPIRNRIISGISSGVVIVEATRKSGSLITASLALEQDRDIFAVPGSINSFKSKGTHFLIKQGAKLVENANDILEEMAFVGNSTVDDNHVARKRDPTLDMDNSEKEIYQIVGEYPMQIDEIVRMVDLEAGEVLSTLLKLELKGRVKQLPGKMFVR